jgi:hypothetical protein
MKLPTRLPQRLPWADPLPAGPSGGRAVTPQYTIRVRDANLVPQGQLAAWTEGDIVLRMNDVGKWALTVKADDALRQYFATRGGGIIVSVDLGDGKGSQTVMSGPVWAIDRLGIDNYYTIGGPTDEWWLKARNVLPQGGRPYMEAALSIAPLRYYRLGEAAGTVAADTSLFAQNATYSAAGVTYGVAGAVAGDPNTAVTLNGTTGWISVPTTGLPTGNIPWTIVASTWMSGNPTSTAWIAGWGNGAIGKNPLLYINTSGQPFVTAQSWGDAGGGAALSLSAWHLLVGTWDGGSMTLYVDGVQRGASTTPGPISTPTTGLTSAIGANGTGSANFFGGRVDEVEMSQTALSAAQVAALYAAWRATHGAYDVRTGICSTVLLGYVNANLIAPTNTDRRNTHIVAALDPVIGTSVSGNARGDNLLALMQQLASSGGDIGFRVLQTANGVLTFSIYQPNDRTTTAKFSQDLKNLFDFSYSLAGPLSNSTEVWGGGVGAARTSLVVQDATSIAAWGLVEGPIIDARDTSDVPTMTQRAQADINANTEQTNLAITPGDTGTVRYGRDYTLGDIVAMTIDGNAITNKIRSVHIELKSPGDEERITPGIGNPTQGDVAHWFDAYQARQQMLTRIQTNIIQIGTRQ